MAVISSLFKATSDRRMIKILHHPLLGNPDPILTSTTSMTLFCRNLFTTEVVESCLFLLLLDLSKHHFCALHVTECHSHHPQVKIS
jgi:hypothetical protein